MKITRLKIVLLLFMSTVLLVINAPHIQGKDEYICEGSFEIRTFLELKNIEKCTSILGNVYVVFPVADNELDVYTSEEINSRKLPLREVTEFMLFFALNKLYSIGSLFPNLTVIRGQRLLSNYAVTLYDTDLNELALRNLLEIQRGNINICGSNPRLCLPNIDWDRIIISGKLQVTGRNAVKRDCENSRCKSCRSPPGLPPYKCWNNRACQRYESSYTFRNQTCHPLCLGPCVNTTANGCLVCKDISEESECVESCSMSRYLNVDSRRCITLEKCASLNMVIYEKECMRHCPAKYSAASTGLNGTDPFCRPCIGPCHKICTFSEIKAISQLEHEGIGCTIIEGNLEIKITEDIRNLTAELDKYLGDVEEVHGHLKIHRSTPITSLTFLNKLHFVKGIETDSSHYSFQIFENQNLQSLFDNHERNGLKLTIQYGSVLIYNNFLLCDNETVNFLNILNTTNVAARVIDYVKNNGNKRLCKNEKIKTDFEVKSHDSCEIYWENLTGNHTDQTGYLLQYLVADGYDEMEFDKHFLFERDICSSFGWQDIILKPGQYSVDRLDPHPRMSYLFTNLNQYTQYAFTIQPYLYVTSEIYENDISGGASGMNMFRTPMYVPSRVRKFSSNLKSEHSIVLQWDVLPSESGGIVEFQVYVFEKTENQTEIDLRDYCIEPNEDIHIPVLVTKSEDESFFEEFELEPVDPNRCCDSCCERNRNKFDENGAEEDHFAKALFAFVDKSPKTFYKYKRNKDTNEGFVKREDIEATTRSFTITDLKVFTRYAFHIHACSDDDRCGDYEMIYERTAASEKYDKIDLNPTSNKYVNEKFSVYFEEPVEKNGLITNYIIELKRNFNNSTHPIKLDCITRLHHEKNNFTYSVDHLPDGDYVFRIMAVSMFGKGPFTDWHYFKIYHSNVETIIMWIVISLTIIIVLTSAGFSTYYYRYRIRTILRRDTDVVLLMQDMAPLAVNDDLPYAEPSTSGLQDLTRMRLQKQAPLNYSDSD